MQYLLKSIVLKMFVVSSKGNAHYSLKTFQLAYLSCCVTIDHQNNIYEIGTNL